MNHSSIDELMQKYKGKMKHVGLQSDEICQTKLIMNGSCSDDERLFAVEGIWVHQRLLTTKIRVKAFLFCPEYVYSNEVTLLVGSFLEKAEKVYLVSQKVFQKLSERDKPDGLITIGEFPELDIASADFGNNAVIAVLDGLETPGNIGTILRTCDGAGVDAVFICNKRARITNPKLIKGSMGAALVLGCERYGISRQWYSANPDLLSIPMLGICDSLNVGTAASVILYEICYGKRVRGVI